MEFSVFSDEHFMNQALREAEIAEAEGEIPIGAIVVCQRKIIAKGHNMTEKLQDVTAHAEIIALGSASEYLGSKYLDQCKLVVTMEPCAMCAGALAWAQVAELVYGAYDAKKGFSQYEPMLLHPKTQVTGGILEEDCSQMVKSFFQNKR